MAALRRIRHLRQSSQVARARFPAQIPTERLVLRPPTLADAGAIADAVGASITELRQWMPWAQGHYGLAEARSFCKSTRQAMIEGREYPLLLTLREDGRLVGSMGLINIDLAVPKAEIGYWLNSADVGHGYCQEAARAATRFAFEQLGAVRVEICMDDRNERSWAVAERLGFTWEATHRSYRRDVHGELADERVYALLDLDDLL